MSFSHYSGCGNDFIIGDDREALYPLEDSASIQKACRDIGVDGMILVQKSAKADFRMRFFNNDGGEAAMCGNGMRCFFKFIREKLHFPQKQAQIETMHRILTVEDCGGLIRVEMGAPEIMALNIQLDGFLFHHINTGVPHAITFVDDVEKIDVAKLGAHFRHHPRFGKEGTNVNFVDSTTLQIRTFERGVEAETLACGTGCTAAAVALIKMGARPSPITLEVRSKEHLTIHLEENNCTMTGPARFIKNVS